MGKGGASAWVVAGVVVVLAVCGVPTAGAVTTVSGDRDSNAPLVIDPSTSPTDAFTRQTALAAETMFFIQRMPVTKRINSLTLGDIGRAAGCTGGEVAAQILEHEGGAWSGATNTRFYATARAPLPAVPGKVTWAFPPSTLKRGHAYSVWVQAFGCGAIKQTTWGHNATQVDGGPLTCEQGPTDKRMWHYAGLDDAPWSCVSRTEPTRKFKPDMPEGWLVSRLGGSTWDIMGGSYANTTPPTSSACGYSSSRNPSLLGATWSYWRPRPDLPSTHSEFVCKWTQFGPPGDQLEDGWYYALPWLTEQNGEPRDMYLKLGAIDQTSEFDAELRAHSPILLYDTLEAFHALNPAAATDFYDASDDPDDPDDANRLVDGSGAFASANHSIASATGLDALSLSFLASPYVGVSRRASTLPTDLDFVSLRGDGEDGLGGIGVDADVYAADAAVMESLTGYPNRVFGRAALDGEGSVWLQYWFFYYADPQTNALGNGIHEGDWEVIQVRLDNARAPSEATYAQHTGGQTCEWSQTETFDGHPVVYVARDSHASFFHQGPYTYPHGDQADGDGVSPTLELVPLSPGNPWADWPGKWGDSGASPRSPAHQPHLKWVDPGAWSDGVSACDEVS